MLSLSVHHVIDNTLSSESLLGLSSIWDCFIMLVTGALRRNTRPGSHAHIGQERDQPLFVSSKRHWTRDPATICAYVNGTFDRDPPPEDVFCLGYALKEPVSVLQPWIHTVPMQCL
nr:hypothetical protein CFP56_72398 [Quercus suber]